MYQFFFCLYHALFTGTWSMTLNPKLEDYINKIFTFIVNALGGDFTSFQYVNFMSDGLSGYALMANILAIITMFGIAFAVLKLTKRVFAIFFGGR